MSWIKLTERGFYLFENDIALDELTFEQSENGQTFQLAKLKSWLSSGTAPGVGVVDIDPKDLEPIVKKGPGTDVVKKPAMPFYSSPNTSSRNGTPIDTIVLHNTDGSYDSCVSWFRNPDSQVSAHYVVGRKGQICQMVEDRNCAWHAGNRTANRRSIGIEIEAHKSAKGLTPEQKASLVHLCRYLQSEYSIEQQDIHPHRHFNSTDCPGHIWPTDALFKQFLKDNLL
jgi:N-acetyl-anhydromuramyl-L-alanine amidase AmpD